MLVQNRLLLPLSFSFSIRYLIRTGLLEEIKQFATPVVILTWKQEDLIQELRQQGVEVHVLPAQHKGALYGNVRRKIDYWFWHFRLRYPSKTVQDKYLNFFKSRSQVTRNRLTQAYNIAKFYTPGFVKNLFKQEQNLLLSDTDYKTIEVFVQSLQAQGVFTVTPFHNAEDLFLRACKNIGLKMMTSILSFDNITKRGWIPVEYDLYMVWNKYNKAELENIYPFTTTKKIVVTGAPQFDFYNKPEWLLTENEWRNEFGLEYIVDRKIILYGGGPKSLFPHEPEYLKQVDKAITNKLIKGNPIILFRCHPVDDIARWKTALKNSENIIFDTSWTGSEKLQLANVTRHDIKKLCSTLAYTDVHINICSTMAIDGSAFNKPQLAPAYFPGTRRGSKLLKNMYLQKHYLPVVESGGLTMLLSEKDMVQQLNLALNNPDKFSGKANKILEEIITYTDSGATKRVAACLREAIAGIG